MGIELCGKTEMNATSLPRSRPKWKKRRMNERRRRKRRKKRRRSRRERG